MPKRIRLLVVLLACSTLACGAYRPARFADRAPITSVRDAPIPRPRPAVIPEWSRYAEAYLKEVLVDGMDPRRTPEAGDIDAFDRVVTSSWFAPTRAPSLAGYATGEPKPPFARVTDDPLLDELELEVVDDAEGRRWQLSRDAPERARLRTASGAITSRLFHALGYPTAESHVIERDGARVLAIDWGAAARVTWLGPTRPTSTRDDDDNDVLPHEDRRSLRALGVVAAWVGLSEVRPFMLRDVYVGEDGAGHVEHQVACVEDALGASVLLAAPRRDDDRPAKNPWIALGSLGFSAKEGADPAAAPFPGVGIFPDHVDPDAMSLAVPFGPARDALPGDLYWMGRRIAAVPDATIAEAVRAGELDADASAYLVRALTQRRDEVGRWAMGLVTPLELRSSDERAIERGLGVPVSIRLRDETIARGYARSSSYAVELVGDDGHRVGAPFEATARGAAVDVEVPPNALEGRDYLVVRTCAIAAAAPRCMEVHLRRGADGAFRVRGLRH